MKLDYKELVIGEWEIKKYNVPENCLRNLIQYQKTGRIVPPGNYTGLFNNGDLYMSDTPDEILDMYEIATNTVGNILVSGLGLGIVLKILLERKSCKSIDVVEKSKDVIDLISPYFNDKRINIINEDIFNFKPYRTYDYAIHDIWLNICDDNISEMKKLRRKLFRYVTFGQSFWKPKIKSISRKINAIRYMCFQEYELDRLARENKFL